jgi:hypothetical protein
MQIKRVILLAITTLTLLCLISAPSFSQRRGAQATPKPVKPQLEVDSSLFPPDPKNIPICTMTLEQAPIIRGFRLGMSADEVAQRFDYAVGNTISAQVAYWKTHTPRNGWFRVEAYGEWLHNLDEFKGIRYFLFDFVNGRLFRFYAYYSGNENWQYISQFIDVISPALNLNQKWDIPNASTALLDCGSIKIEARLNDLPSLMIFNTAGVEEAAKLKAEAEKRKQEEEEKRRRDFKP